MDEPEGIKNLLAFELYESLYKGIRFSNAGLINAGILSTDHLWFHTTFANWQA